MCWIRLQFHTRRLIVMAVVAACLATFMDCRLAAQVGTAFTYQGRLESGGTPFSGAADFEFRLFHQSDSATQVGPTWTLPSVSVVQGLFTVDLDFGPNPFSGDSRWLEIRVRIPAGGGGGFTVLAPRQRIGPTPYALFALNTPSPSPFAIIGSNAVYSGGNVGIGTNSPQTGLHVRGEQATLRLEDDDDPNSFTEIKDAQPTQLRINKVNDNGLVLFDFNPVPADGTSNAIVRFFRETNTAGPKSVQFLRGNFTTQTSASIGVDGTDSWFQLHGGNMGIGTATPTAKLHVVGGTGQGVHSTGAPGVYGLANSTSDYGGTFAGAGAFGSGRSLLVAGDSHTLGFVGVGTTSPVARLDVQTNTSIAVRGVNTSGSGSAYGVFASSQSPQGIGAYGSGFYGVYGFSTSGGFDSVGAYCRSNQTHGVGVQGYANVGNNAAGVLGTGTSGWAGYFEGSVRVENNFLVSGSKQFFIDHPLDPENKYLAHSCVESDEMKNIYDGTVTLNDMGEAVVTLPEWFEHLNADFRYQLTCIGGYAPVYVKHELTGGVFVIAGEGSRAPGLKVSWQITGNRIDPAARDSGFQVEIAKPLNEQGKFLHPAGYGRAESDRTPRMANPSPRVIKTEAVDE